MNDHISHLSVEMVNKLQLLQQVLPPWTTTKLLNAEDIVELSAMFTRHLLMMLGGAGHIDETTGMPRPLTIYDFRSDLQKEQQTECVPITASNLTVNETPLNSDFSKLYPATCELLSRPPSLSPPQVPINPLSTSDSSPSLSCDFEISLEEMDLPSIREIVPDLTLDCAFGQFTCPSPSCYLCNFLLSGIQMACKSRKESRKMSRKQPTGQKKTFPAGTEFDMVSSTENRHPSNQRRVRSSEKERRRNNDINDAFLELQCRIPTLQKTQRLPRIKTLRLAILYIHWLNNYLSGQTQGDFSQIAMQEMQIKNSYTSRILEEEERAHQRYLAGHGVNPLSSELEYCVPPSYALFPPQICPTLPTYWSLPLSSPDSYQSTSSSP